MTIRNYDDINPKTVISNIEKVLKNMDMTLLSKQSYRFLITHCGFIAHYNYYDFIESYKDHLDDFVSLFLKQPANYGWNRYLDNKNSYLYDVSYKGVLLADIIRALIPIFEKYENKINKAVELKTLHQDTQLLYKLADKLGYDVIKREEKQ